MRDQRGRDFAERVRDGGLVVDLRLLELSDVGVVLVLQSQALEERPGQAGRNRPGLSEAEQIGDLRADAAESTGQADRGKEAGERGADVGVRCQQLLFALAQVRTALEESRRQPRRDLDRNVLLRQARASRNRPGILAEQEGDQVFLGLDLTLELRNGRSGAPQSRLGARDLQPRGEASGEPPVEEIVGSLKGLGRPPRDLQPRVELAKLEIRLRDFGHDGQENGPASFLGRHVLSQRRFGEPTDSPPEIDLPGRAEIDLVEIDRRRIGADERGPAAARPVRLVLKLRKELRARDAGPRPELLDAPGRRANVVVVAQRLVDQSLQRVVAEDLPPRPIGQ